MRLGPPGLPRRLAPVLPSPYSSAFLQQIKVFKKENTLDYFITLTSIVKFPRLLHPVELGIVSQIPSQGSSAKNPY